MPDASPTRFDRQDVEVFRHERLYDGFLKVDRYTLRCRLFEGGWSPEFHREALVRPHGIGVLLYDPLLDKVLLVEQFRIGCLGDACNGPWALELVAGLQDTGETSQEVARREAVEEAGVHVKALTKVCEYYNSPGGSCEKLTIYCAGFDAGTTPTGIFGLKEEAENIRTRIVDRQQALRWVREGRIVDAMCIIALQWLELNLAETRRALSPS